MKSRTLHTASTKPDQAKGVMQRQCACGNQSHGASKCAQCRNHSVGLLQRYPGRNQSGNGLSRSPYSIVREVLNSAGRPLDAQTRGFMESRFRSDLLRAPVNTQATLKIGEVGDRFEQEADRIAEQVTQTQAAPLAAAQRRIDFSSVRVHTDARAAASARALDARAYTVGPHIVFDSGEYAPGTSAGSRLLAHELSHAVQQGSVTSQSTGSVIQRQPRTPPGTAPAPARRLEFQPSINGRPCACLVFIHNNEPNARAAAQELHRSCRYNLAIIQPGTDREIPVPGRSGTVDPNELFPRDVQEDCTRDERACAAYAQSHNDLRAMQIQFFLSIRDCSDNFSLPTVALHNNVLTDTQAFLTATSQSQRQALRGDFERGTATGPGSRQDLRTRLGGRSGIMDRPRTTNIFRWCNLLEISRCHVGDPDRPDNVIWVTNTADFNRLQQQNVNVVLQEGAAATSGSESETDLSTLFLRQGQRYINIETPSTPQTAAARADNLAFIQQALGHLGLRCCEPVTIEPMLPIPLPYRQAVNLTECIRIMGEENAAFCRRQIVRELREEGGPGLFGGRRLPITFGGQEI
jgi:hypothetical protein